MSEQNDKNLSSKSELERKIFAGVHGSPELKKDEKNRHLGEFKERVIKALTFDQVQEQGTYPEINEAIKHPKAKRLIISRKVDLDYARDYIKLAREQGLNFTTVDDPDFVGPIGLVVVSDDAFDNNEIYVQTRKDKLLEKGLSEELIDAKEEYICSDCIKELEEKAPEELSNYKKISFLDKMLGRECISCNN
ncbi:YueI family protein [Natranaerobius trueperi]|uniref:YueI family protein n=1 Tax=Natranaerobius trueperi TaxID=759412 RepID=UPI001F0AE721|nr:YueI family protein [Natranaerobius trueperi]